MTSGEERICYECGRNNPAFATVCSCGKRLTDVVEAKRKYPLWLALVPVLMVPSYFLMHIAFQFGRASESMQVEYASVSAKDALGCVVPYGVTQHSSEFWTTSRESDHSKLPTEKSTVLRGMVRNDCGTPLKHVRLYFLIRDEKEQAGMGTLDIYDVDQGGVKEFERAFMGAIVSWEITASK